MLTFDRHRNKGSRILPLQLPTPVLRRLSRRPPQLDQRRSLVGTGEERVSVRESNG